MKELWTFAKGTIVGLIALVAEVGLIAVLETTRAPAALNFALVQLVGTAITFGLGKVWAFDAAHSGKTWRELARSVVVFAVSWAGNTLVPSLLVYGLAMAPIPAFLVSQVIVYLAWNYPASRWWVFA